MISICMYIYILYMYENSGRTFWLSYKHLVRMGRSQIHVGLENSRHISAGNGFKVAELRHQTGLIVVPRETALDFAETDR